MKVDELIKQLASYKDENPYVYINREANWEDEFVVRLADTGNLLLIPQSEYSKLKDSQEFYFIED